MCLQGILYVLHNDISRQRLPPERGLGSGHARQRQLGRWHKSGGLDRLYRLPARLHTADRPD
ncbi:hypothetical protein ACMATS_37550 [Streptoverticillium reticulum]|uniref:hypothetical protein n=1 Tax=Streptoverticillium reticulum TaxID=1433415 RepID=UPI0039BF68AA